MQNPLQLIFPTIEKYTGLCLSKNVVVSRREKRKCIKSGHEFYSFDISGHAFLMVYCVLTLMMESRAMRRFFALGHGLRRITSDGDHSSNASDTESVNQDDVSDPVNDATEQKLLQEEGHESISDSEISKFENTYMNTWPFIVIAYFCVCLLCITWDIVLIITTIYYHTIIEKVLGTLIAVGSFSFLYKYVFVKLDVL